jgi:magnesium transporter
MIVTCAELACAVMEVLTSVDPPRMRELLDRDEFFWADLVSPSEEALTAMGTVLRLHPVALEDTREFGQRPKLDDYRDHVLLVFFTARLTGRDLPLVERLEVHVYVSGSFIVTVHHKGCDALDHLHDVLVPEGTDEEEFLVYRILDTLTDAFYPAITALEERIDALEAVVLARPRREQLTETYRLKQEVHDLSRLAVSQRDMFGSVADAILHLTGLSKGSRAYLRDVGDHLSQITGELQRQTDDLMALTSTYFNANADRLNAVATRVTIAGTLFLAWTLVTGFFGQNFGWLVRHIDGFTHFLVLGVGGLVVPTLVLLTLFWVKRNDWF